MADLGSKVRGFVDHYGREIRVLSSVLETIVSALPLQHQDKDRISEILNGLQTAADNIAGSLKDIPSTTVAVKKSDVEAAVRKVLPGIVKSIMDENKSNA